MSQHSKRWLLIVDLDGVLLADAGALGRFREWYQSHSPRVLLAYFTDRSAAGVCPCFTNLSLPHPDYLITSLGTQIISFPSGVLVPNWPANIHGRWNSVAVKTALEVIPDLRLQSDDEQAPHTVSYFLIRAAPDQIVQIEQTLSRNGIDADVVYSEELCLHVIPKGFGNGAAAEFLAGYLNFPRDRVTVCGRSRRDLSMFHLGFCGVVVANAESDLAQAVPASSHLSLLANADGAVDGIRYWMSVKPVSLREIVTQTG